MKITNAMRASLSALADASAPMSAQEIGALFGASEWAIGRIMANLPLLEMAGWADSEWGVAPTPGAARPRLYFITAAGCVANDEMQRKD